MLSHRSERCGECHTCLNRQLKRACLTVRAEQEREARAQVHCLLLPTVPDAWRDGITESNGLRMMTFVAANLYILFLCATHGGTITCQLLRGFSSLCVASWNIGEWSISLRA